MIDEDEDTTAEAADDAPVAEADDDAAEVDMAPADTAEPGDPGVPSPDDLMDDPGPPITGMKADAQEHVDQALDE